MKTGNFEDYCPFGGSKCWISGGFSHNLGEPIHTKQETEEQVTRARKFRSTLSSHPPPPPRCGVVYWRWWWLERCKATWDWNFEPVPVEQISPRGFLSANPRTYPPRLVGFGINRLCSCSFFHIPACYACCSSFCLVVCRFKHDNMCCLLTRYLLITFYIAA